MSNKSKSAPTAATVESADPKDQLHNNSNEVIFQDATGTTVDKNTISVRELGRQGRSLACFPDLSADSTEDEISAAAVRAIDIINKLLREEDPNCYIGEESNVRSAALMIAQITAMDYVAGLREAQERGGRE